MQALKLWKQSVRVDVKGPQDQATIASSHQMLWHEQQTEQAAGRIVLH